MQEKWNQRYAAITGEPQASRVLQENHHLLPAEGDALDLACGLGGNALLLARSGLDVQAWDLSSVAIEALRVRAAREDLAVMVGQRDVLEQPPGVESFDVIVVSYFLERGLAPLLCTALRPGGLLFYQTFVRDRVSARGPDNPDFLLEENELRDLFAPLCLRVYREEGSVGDVHQGLRDEALLVAQRPLKEQAVSC